jgi:hypothetical protein
VLEYGLFGLAGASGLILLVRDFVRRRPVPPGASFAILATLVFSLLYLTWVRMTIFLAQINRDVRPVTYFPAACGLKFNGERVGRPDF